MTSMFGGAGGTNIGTAQGRVKITYESSGVAKAIKDVQALQNSLTATGSVSTKLGKTGGIGLAQQIAAEVANANKALAGLSITNANGSMVSNARLTGRAISNAFISEVGTIAVQGNLVGQNFGKKLEESGKQSAQSAGSNIGKAASGALALGMKAGVAASAAVAASAVAGVGYVLYKGFSRLEAIDLAANKLKALGHTTATVKTIMDSALESVQGTAFSLDQAANTAAQAVAAGIKPGKDLTNYLKEVADNAAIANVSLDDMGYYFNRVVTAGRLTGETLEMLLQRGIPVFTYLAKVYGISEAKAAEMARNGEVDFAHFREAMNLNEGAAKKMGNSISGSLDNLKTAVARLGATILAPIFGTASGEASTFAKAIQSVSDAVDGFGRWLSEHKDDVVNFWTAAGKAVLLFGHLVIDIVGWTLEGIGKLIEGIGHVPSAFAGLFDALGAHGIAKNLRQASDNMTNWGQATFKAGQQVFHVNPIIDALENKLDAWSKNAKDATKNTDKLGDSMADTAPKAIGLSEALEKLGLKSDKVSDQIKGSSTEYRKLLDELAKKGATQDVIDGVEQLRKQWENGGYAIKSFADAIDKFGDATASADDKAQSFIRSLQALGMVPDDSALIRYNKDMEETLGLQSDIVDMHGVLGDALVQANGQINVNTKNGQSLSETISKIIQDSTALVASGKASPEEAYGRSTEWITAVLAKFGITDPAAVQAVLQKYFPQQAFIDAIRAGDPKTAIEKLFKDDPAKIQTELQLLSTANDVLKGIVGPDGKLHVPTVLDVPGAGGVAGPGGGSGGPGFDIHNLPGTYGPKPVPTGPALPPTAPGAPQALPNQLNPTDLGGLLGAAGGNYQFTPGQQQAFVSLLNNPEALSKAFAANPDIQQALQPMVDAANAQGQNMAVALSQGLLQGDEAVRNALIKLATMAGDYLGHSPAKYGPLSGKGWTFYRGQQFANAWADGVASQQGYVANSVALTAAAGIQPFDEKWKQTIGDLQDFSDLSKHVWELVNSGINVAFSVGQLVSNLTGKFGKSNMLGPWNPQGWNPYDRNAKGGLAGGTTAAPAGLAANAGKQDIANYIINKALSLGYSRDQANAIATQAFGESGLVPDISGGPQGGAGAANEVIGIFQEKPAFAIAAGISPDQRANAQANIDAYFNALAKAGGPNTSDIKGLLAQVSGGGPAHPSNVGAWDQALAGVLPYLNAFAPTALGGAGGITSLARPGILHDYLQGVSTGPQGVAAAAIISQLFPQITEIGGSGARPGHEGTHDVGRAIDIMMPGGDTYGGANPAGKALGDQINQYLQTHAKDLGIQYTIWQNQGQYPGGPPGAFTSPGHYNHIDVQFTGGQANVNLPQQANLTSIVTPIANAVGGQQPAPGLMASPQDFMGGGQGGFSLEQAQGLFNNVSGLVGDFFGVIDESLKSVAATQTITDTLVRGVANTKDVNTLIDSFQQYLSLAGKVASFTGDIFQMVGGIVQGAGAGSAGGDMGGTMAAGMALSAVGSGAQIASQVIAGVNAAIDVGQEVWKISTKYLGRFLESWFGLPGANDIKYLLDTAAGQLKVYSGENPDMKTVLNTFGKETGLYGRYSERPSPTNYFQIFQGPGQDPRDTMDDAMFTVRSSGVGVFGYGD